MVPLVRDSAVTVWLRKGSAAVCWVRKSSRPLILLPLVLNFPVIPLAVTVPCSKKHRASGHKHCLGAAVAAGDILRNPQRCTLLVISWFEGREYLLFIYLSELSQR